MTFEAAGGSLHELMMEFMKERESRPRMVADGFPDWFARWRAAKHTDAVEGVLQARAAAGMQRWILNKLRERQAIDPRRG